MSVRKGNKKIKASSERRATDGDNKMSLSLQKAVFHLKLLVLPPADLIAGFPVIAETAKY